MGFGVYFEVTNACNLRCKTCLPASAKPRPRELSASQIIDSITRLHSKGAESVFFSGGEPFFRPDFLSIIEAVGKLNLRVAVVTSGTICTPEVIDTLKRHGVEVSVSLDGAYPESNDKIRGAGVFGKALAGIKQFVTAGLKVTLSVTVTRQNFEDLQDMALLAEQSGCSRVLYSEVVEGGRASRHWNLLALTPEQRAQLPTAVERAALKVFGDEIEGSDDRCWVDGSSVYINSEGSAYMCSEIYQRRPDLSVADVRSEAGVNKLLAAMRDNHGHRACCYEVIAGPHVTLIANLERPCALVELAGRRAVPIADLGQLRREVDRLWEGIEQSCANCTDPDCVGYIWVMPEEEGALLDAGVQTVQVNGADGPIFIDSYPRDERGHLIVNRSKSRCPYLDDKGRCGVHAVRPLTCHLYPLGPETLADGRAVWALHTDCAHVRGIQLSGGQDLLISKIRRLLSRISPQLRRDILNVYEKVEAISAFPDGPNNYLVVEDV